LRGCSSANAEAQVFEHSLGVAGIGARRRSNDPTTLGYDRAKSKQPALLRIERKEQSIKSSVMSPPVNRANSL